MEPFVELSTHECQIRFANIQCKHGYRSTINRMVCVQPAAPGVDRSHNFNEPGMKPVIHASTTLRTGWKSQPIWLIADWLGSVEAASTGVDTVSSPDQKSYRV